MAVLGACQCYAADCGPCACAQVTAQMMQDIARLNDKVRFVTRCFVHLSVYKMMMSLLWNIATELNIFSVQCPLQALGCCNRLGLFAAGFSIRQSFFVMLFLGLLFVYGKGKVFPYSLPSAGPGADPSVQAGSQPAGDVK